MHNAERKISAAPPRGRHATPKRLSPRLRLLLFAPAICFAAAAAAGGMRLFSTRSGDHESQLHPHRSLYGGLVQAIGQHHIEVLVEQEGKLHLFILGEDETELFPLAAREIAAHAQPENSSEAIPLVLRANPQPAEPEGFSSAFTGTLPAALRNRPMTLTLTLPLGDRARRVRLSVGASHPDGSHTDAEIPPMPATIGTNEQQALHRTPGGRYTMADIRANGGVTPWEKYRGIPIRHNPQPAVGDPICPITRTQANPRLRWTVGGKEYRFCCPPCIDEFVQRAKQDPIAIRPPEEYIRR